MTSLEDEIKCLVRLFNPQTVSQAFPLAKILESNIKKQKVKFTANKTPILPNPTKYTNQPFNTQKPATNSTTLPPRAQTQPTNRPRATFKPNFTRKTLTPAEFDDRRARGLCYFCDDKFTPGHKCKGKRPQFYHLELEMDEEDVEEEGEEENTRELAQIFVHALAGITNFQTLRVTGHHGKNKLQVLLDIGSTHNFLDTSLAYKVEYKMTKMGSMKVRAADGSSLACDTMVEGFQWKMQGLTFTSDMFLMLLGGYDMALGVQWFTSLGIVHFDYTNHSIDFPFQGKRVTLRRATIAKVKTVRQQKLEKIIQQEEQ